MLKLPINFTWQLAVKKNNLLSFIPNIFRIVIIVRATTQLVRLSSMEMYIYENVKYKWLPMPVMLSENQLSQVCPDVTSHLLVYVLAENNIDILTTACQNGDSTGCFRKHVKFIINCLNLNTYVHR